MKPEIISTNLSRRKMLRESAVVAAGSVLLPSLLTGCRKEYFEEFIKRNPKGGVVLTPVDLKAAGDNIKRLRAWIVDLYPLCIEYEDAVFRAMESSKQDPGWKNFVVNIFIDVAIGIAATAAVAAENPIIIPALAGLSAFLHDWGIGKSTPPNLNGTFSEFEVGHNKMQFEIEQKLSSLADPTNNYSNLTAAWKDNIVFNGKTYTISDLATSNFPDLGDAYNKLQLEAYTYFKKALWNLVIIKTCTFYRNYDEYVQLPKHAGALVEYARSKFYPQHKGVYLRGEFIGTNSTINEYQLTFWNLGISQYPFPEAACKILFKDDTPGHIINPDGLFYRSYVFQQFSTTKPDFTEGRELANTTDRDFSGVDDWTFTGGLFPSLTK